MVFLVLSRRGFDEMLPRVDRGRDAVWVYADILSTEEIAELRQSGLNLTVFVHRGDAATAAYDLDTVVEHHPNQVLWVEAVRTKTAGDS